MGKRNLQQVINLLLLVFIFCILLHERKATKLRLLLHKPQCNGRMLKCLLTSRTCSSANAVLLAFIRSNPIHCIASHRVNRTALERVPIRRCPLADLCVSVGVNVRGRRAKRETLASIDVQQIQY